MAKYLKRWRPYNAEVPSEANLEGMLDSKTDSKTDG